MHKSKDDLVVKRHELIRKLSDLTSTQASIESLSKWCTFYQKDARTIVACWEEEFFRASSEKKLTLIYLANHILQESRKKGREYTVEFFRPLTKAFKLIASVPEHHVRDKVERLFKIWEERKVFQAPQLQALRDQLHKAPTSGMQVESLPKEDRRKLDVLEPIAQHLVEVQEATEKTSQVMQQTMKLQELVEAGGDEALQAALQVLGIATDVLRVEQNARNRAMAALRTLLGQQEDGYALNAQRLDSCMKQINEIQQHLPTVADRSVANMHAQARPQPMQQQMAPQHPSNMPGSNPYTSAGMMPNQVPGMYSIPTSSPPVYEPNPWAPPSAPSPALTAMLSGGFEESPSQTAPTSMPPHTMAHIPANPMQLQHSGSFGSVPGKMEYAPPVKMEFSPPAKMDFAPQVQMEDAPAGAEGMPGTGGLDLSGVDMEQLIATLTNLKDNGAEVLAAALQNLNEPAAYDAAIRASMSTNANGSDTPTAPGEDHEYDPEFPD